MKPLADLSIRNKFLLLPALAAVLLILLGAVYSAGQQKENLLQDRINRQDVPRMRELSRLFSEFSANHSQFIGLLAGSLRSGVREGAFYAAGRQKIIAVNRTAEELLALGDHQHGAGHGDTRRLHQRLIEYRDQMGETVLMGSVDREQIARFTLQANQAYDAANTDFLALIDAEQEHIGLESRQLQAHLEATRLRFFLMLAATIAIIAIGSLLLSRAFAADLTALMGMLARLGAGDTEIPIPATRRRDEFGAVHEVVRAFREALQRRDQAESGMKEQIAERVRIGERLRLLNDELEQRVVQRTEQLNAAKQEAERANQAKSEFLSRMSHELRTPLNAILGFGQLLEMKPAATEPNGHVREILRAGQHLLELIDEVLDLSRVESGMLAVSAEPVALLPLVQECLTLLRPQAQAQGIRLLDVSSHCDVHVRADRTRLKQVLLNLLSNAIKYNRPQGSVNVVCVVEHEASPPGLWLRISDTGHGLTPAQRDRLFVPFERLDAQERRIPGTGIGLALSRRLVELMHGSIGVESTPGTGSTFWVRLALAQAPQEPASPAIPAEARPAARAAEVRRDLLCIEDNPANLRLIESVFAQRTDIRLLSAMAPGLGLELARTHRPAVILLDINLPDMDGYAVLQCLRESEATRHIPVVAVSANAMPRDIERGRAAGFAEYLTKPLDIARLIEVVDRLAAAPPRAPP